MDVSTLLQAINNLSESVDTLIAHIGIQTPPVDLTPVSSAIAAIQVKIDAVNAATPPSAS